MRECVHARVCGHHERGEGVKVALLAGRETKKSIDLRFFDFLEGE